LIFNKYYYPEANDKLIIEKIEAIKKQIWIELNYQLTPIEQIRVFNLIFFKHQHFHSNFEHPTDAKNNFITYNIETKKGNQIGLGLIYLLVAQQLRMPVYGVCLKNYFVICYVDTDVFQSDINYINQQDILFYINPYNLGAIFNRPQILDYLQKIKSEVKDKYFYPATNIEIMKELITQTANDYQLLKENDKVNEMMQLLQLLKK
ncbi:MAG: hypothetical protein RIQ33_752, partial [Bacteroidota bacterium]